MILQEMTKSWAIVRLDYLQSRAMWIVVILGHIPCIEGASLWLLHLNWT